jgi:hypothetical protein
VYVSLRQVSASSGDARQYASSLWRVVRTASGWSAPERLPNAVNISQRMHNPSIAANGDLYFHLSDDAAWAGSDVGSLSSGVSK